MKSLMRMVKIAAITGATAFASLLTAGGVDDLTTQTGVASATSRYCETEPGAGSDFEPCEVIVKFHPTADTSMILSAVGATSLENFKDPLPLTPDPDSSLSPADLAAIADNLDMQRIEITDLNKGVYVVISQLLSPSSPWNIPDYMVLSAEPDSLLLQPDDHQTAPNDLIADQWNLLNMGQSPGGEAGVGRGNIDADVDVSQGWDLHATNDGAARVDCTSVVVGVMDTGIDMDNDGNGTSDTREANHGDFADAGGHNYWSGPLRPTLIPFNLTNRVRGYDATTNPVTEGTDNNPAAVQDWMGHGTAVASVIGARGNNGRAITGICWRAQIMGLKIFPDPGNVAAGGFVSSFVRAVTAAIAQKKVNTNMVLNCSCGGPTSEPAEARAIKAAEIANILFVVSAGNASTDVDVNPRDPCTANRTLDALGFFERAKFLLQTGAVHARNLVCVANSGYRDTLYPSSNYGAATVDLAAPGGPVDVLGSVAYNADLAAAGPGCPALGQGTNVVARNMNRYYIAGARGAAGVKVLRFGGTSCAAPNVTGIAALCWSVGGKLADLKARELKDLIIRFVDRKTGVQMRVGGGGAATITGGRLRWPCSSDLGDFAEPNPPAVCGYHTVANVGAGAAKTHLIGSDGCNGPAHLDTGNEWLGEQVSDEHNANTPRPLDEDPLQNIPDQDASDDGFFGFVQDGAGVVTMIHVRICSDAFGRTDSDGGRYGNTLERQIFINGFFDWNANGAFDLQGEHNVDFGINATGDPAIKFPLAGGYPVDPTDVSFPPLKKCMSVDVPFFRPAPVAGLPVAWRIGLSYGEDVSRGAHMPKGYWGADPLPAMDHKDIATFGEVEDYQPPVPVAPVGGIAGLLENDAAPRAEATGGSGGAPLAPIAAAVAAGVAALVAGGWYARKRWVRR